MYSSISAIELINLNNFLEGDDLISAVLSMVGLSLLMDTTPVLYQKSVDDITIYASVSSVYVKQSNKVTPELLSKMWRIGIKTD